MIEFSVYAPPEPKVYAYKCPECGTLHYPAPMICKNCSARRDPSNVFFSSWEQVPLGGKCKLLTWTRLYSLPVGYMKKYLLFGIVEFPNGLRASGQLAVEEPKIGMQLEAKAGLVREKLNEDAYGFIFHPAKRK
jgi:hypothetical protein